MKLTIVIDLGDAEVIDGVREVPDGEYSAAGILRQIAEYLDEWGADGESLNRPLRSVNGNTVGTVSLS